MIGTGTGKSNNGVQETIGPKLLVISDVTEALNSQLQGILEFAGYVVEDAAIGSEAAVEVDSFNPDLVLMDVMTPSARGFTVCEQIRGISNVPIVVLAETSDRGIKTRWLESGADIYFVKDTGLDEFMACVRSALRWATPVKDRPPTEGYWYSDAVLEIDVLRHRVNVRQVPVDLTPAEYGVLITLIQANGNPVAIDEIAQGVWDIDRDPEGALGKITRLRHRVEADPGRPEIIVSRGVHRYAYVAPARPGTLLHVLDADRHLRLLTNPAEHVPV